MSFTDSSSFDPFVGTEQETLHHYRTFVSILVNGVDVTSQIRPFLISVRVRDTGLLEAEVELDDRDAKLPIPPHFSPLQISLGWISGTVRQVFDGMINEVWHDFSRKGGGRRMTIRGTGANLSPQAKIKMPMTAHMGEGAPPGQQEGPPIQLSAWLEDVASRAGGTVYVGPSLNDVKDDRWDQENQSAMDLMNALAEKFGAVRPVRIQSGNHFIFVRSTDPIPAASGAAVTAKWNDGSGGNLIGWHLSPISARPSWGGSYNKYFDTQQGQWIFKQIDFSTTVPGDGSNVGTTSDPTLASINATLPQPAPNFQPGDQTTTISGPALFQQPMPGHNEYDVDNMNSGAAADRALAGQGKIIIDGEPTAAWMGSVTVVGARPGVDGTYWIMEAEHFYSRQGYITTLDVGIRL